ncbi:hypothetical protein ANN_17747 [Periplaneta americana]|uniref:Uncharacterized protein n=1 Tax=Periplaneta americana TaxID=6978 RepID=A0ABQ8SVC5_PERAM|nr:hypothetical protein ANN_17747 [Periplaneta americana]
MNRANRAEHYTTNCSEDLMEMTEAEALRLQLLQTLMPDDKVRCFEFSTQLQQLMEEDGFCEKLIFSDEATFLMAQ